MKQSVGAVIVARPSTLRRALALVAGALIAQACADSGAGPRRGQLRIAIPRDAGPLNLYVGANDYLLGLVYDKLFEPSPYVEAPEPGLAESATQIDSLTWLVRLREGVRWHDGVPFTAGDVKFTYEYYRDGPPNRHSHHVSAVPRIDRIEVVGPRELRFVCGYPCPTLARITLADLPILPRHVWQNVTEPRKITSLPVGTGPYRLVEYRPDQLYRFRANGDYFHGRPLVDEIIMPVIPDQSSTFIALKTAQVDVAARELPPELLSQFDRLPGISVVNTAPLSIVELRPNYRRTPFDRPAFRRALSLAVDRRALVETVLLGQGRPGTRGYPHPDSPWTSPTLSTPFDRAEARRLLDSLALIDRDRDGVREAPNGSALSFTLKVSSAEPSWIRVGELLARQFALVGVKLTLETVDAGVLSAKVAARDFDLFISEIGAHGVADPDQFIMSHRSGYLWKDDLPYPAMDSLIEMWKHATTVDTRKLMSFRIQELFNHAPTSIALYYPNDNWAFRPTIFDKWAETPGYGIVHKWSFLPPQVRGRTIVRSFEERGAP